jgi:PAS domain S-box-containing protein
MKKKPVALPHAELRRQAEARLSQHEKEKGEELSKTNADLQRLLHELQVHQIELEMQNEELLQTRMQLERMLEMYVGMYTLARVGYFTVTHEGIVISANATGLQLLGAEQNAVIGKRFDSFVSPESRITFRTFLNKILTTGQKAICEINLQKDWATRLLVHIVGASESLSEQDGVCYMIVSEITESTP